MLLASVSLVHSGPWTRGNRDYYRRNNPPVKSESSELVDDTVKKEIVAAAERDARNNVNACMWMWVGASFILGPYSLAGAYLLKPSMPKMGIFVDSKMEKEIENDFSGESAEHAEIYEEAYKAEVKKIRRSSAWIGCVSWSVLWGVLSVKVLVKAFFGCRSCLLLNDGSLWTFRKNVRWG